MAAGMGHDLLLECAHRALRGVDIARLPYDVPQPQQGLGRHAIAQQQPFVVMAGEIKTAPSVSSNRVRKASASACAKGKSCSRKSVCANSSVAASRNA